MAKLSPSELRIPLFRLVGEARAGRTKLVQVEARGPEEVQAPQGFWVIETGRNLEAHDGRREGDVYRFGAKGLPTAALKAGLELLPETWPLAQAPRALFVPLGAGNQRFEPGRAFLKGPLLGGRGREVTVARRSAGENGERFLVQITASRALPCLIGAPYTLTDARGQEVPLALLAHDPLRDRDLEELARKAFKYPGQPSVKALYSLNLRLRGWVELPPPLWNDEFEDAAGTGGVRVLSLARKNLSAKLLRLCQKPGGIRRADLRASMDLPPRVLDALLAPLRDEGQVKIEEGWVLPGKAPEAYLSPLAKNFIKKLEERGLRGLKLELTREGVERDTYEALSRMGAVRTFEGGVLVGPQAWAQILTHVCGPGRLGHVWILPRLREELEPCRTFLLSVVQALESEGWLEDTGQGRRVVKEYGPAT